MNKDTSNPTLNGTKNESRARDSDKHMFWLLHWAENTHDYFGESIYGLETKIGRAQCVTVTARHF